MKITKLKLNRLAIQYAELLHYTKLDNRTYQSNTHKKVFTIQVIGNIMLESRFITLDASKKAVLDVARIVKFNGSLQSTVVDTTKPLTLF